MSHQITQTVRWCHQKKLGILVSHDHNLLISLWNLWARACHMHTHVCQLAIDRPNKRVRLATRALMTNVPPTYHALPARTHAYHQDDRSLSILPRLEWWCTPCVQNSFIISICLCRPTKLIMSRFFFFFAGMSRFFSYTKIVIWLWLTSFSFGPW
jgi:hypothetical protein